MRKLDTIILEYGALRYYESTVKYKIKSKAWNLKCN